MKKRVIAFLMSAMMIAGVTGCGTSSQQAAPESTSTETAGEAAEGTAEVTAAAPS